MKLDTIAIIAAAGLGLFLLSSTLKTTVAGAIPRGTTGGTASSLNAGGSVPFGTALYGGITPFGMASFGNDPYGLGALYGNAPKAAAGSNPFNAFINK